MNLHRRGRGSWCAVVALALGLAGCATLKNTPQQDLAYARWAKCEPPSGLIDIERVEPNGRIWFTFYNESERIKMVECLAKAEPSGETLPTPVAVLRGRGGA